MSQQVSPNVILLYYISKQQPLSQSSSLNKILIKVLQVFSVSEQCTYTFNYINKKKLIFQKQD